MSDEFLETDLETPTEHDVDEAYGSRFLGVTDVGTKKIKSKLSKVRKEEVKDRDSGRMKKKIIVFFEGVDKGLVLNVTNKDILTDALGKAPAGWLGATIGILVDPNVGFGGKKTGGVRLRVLQPPAAAKSPKPVPTPVKPTPAAAAPPAADDGDPGPAFDPDFNDMVPDLSAG